MLTEFQLKLQNGICLFCLLCSDFHDLGTKSRKKLEIYVFVKVHKVVVVSYSTADSIAEFFAFKHFSVKLVILGRKKTI